MIDEALLRVLSAHAGAPQAFAQPPAPMTGGFWAAIYGFELDRAARRPARPAWCCASCRSRDAGSRRNDRAAHGCRAGLSDAARRARRHSTKQLGGAFMVMQRVEGVASARRASASAGRCGRCRRPCAECASQLSVASVRLHDLDPQPVIDALDEAGIDIAVARRRPARLNEIRASGRQVSSPDSTSC